MFPSSTKHEISLRHFYVVIVQRRQRNVQKSVMHVQVVFCQSKQIAFLLLSLNGAPLLIAPLSWPLPEIQHLLIKTEIAWSF